MNKVGEALLVFDRNLKRGVLERVCVRVCAVEKQNTAGREKKERAERAHKQ